MTRQSKAEKRKLRKAESAARRKQPTTQVHVPLEKRPIPGPPVETDPDERIVFRLSWMDHDGDFSWAGLSTDDVRLVAQRCKSWETLRAGEFIGQTGTKPIPFVNMSPVAQKRAAEIELDVFDGLWELRLGGKQRIWGLLDGHVFYIVWWDPDHQVCPSTKKHT